jgi:hypothetical protein
MVVVIPYGLGLGFKFLYFKPGCPELGPVRAAVQGYDGIFQFRYVRRGAFLVYAKEQILLYGLAGNQKKAEAKKEEPTNPRGGGEGSGYGPFAANQGRVPAG